MTQPVHSGLPPRGAQVPPGRSDLTGKDAGFCVCAAPRRAGSRPGRRRRGAGQGGGRVCLMGTQSPFGKMKGFRR